MTVAAAWLTADGWGWHHDGAGVLMTIGMVLFWIAIIALVVWAVRSSARRPDARPEEILRRRLADGSISVEEYEQRRAALEAPTPPHDRPA